MIIKGILSLLYFMSHFCATLYAQGEIRNINGVQLYTRVIGEGKPIVIVHGGPGLDHSYLLPQMGELGKYFRLILFDLRASGRSSVDIDSNSMTLENLIEDIDGIRKSFGVQKVNLMGHSWGGFLAMSYAIKYPEHISSLLLINTVPASSKRRDETERISRSRITKEDSAARSALLRTEAFRKRTPDAMASLFRIVFGGSFYDRRYADSLTLTFQSNYSSSSAMLQYLFKDQTLRQYDLHQKLGTIQCPTLLLGGDHDQVSPDVLQEIHISISSSKLVILKNCGHFSYIECKEDFVAAVKDFLK